MAKNRNNMDKLVNDPVVKRIIKEMYKLDISDGELAIYCGLSISALTRWKYYGSKSYMRHIDKIAEKLNVSKDYLLAGADDKGIEKYDGYQKQFVTKTEKDIKMIYDLISTMDDETRKIYIEIGKKFNRR